MVEVTELLEPEPGGSVEAGKESEDEAREVIPAVCGKENDKDQQSPYGTVYLGWMDGCITKNGMGK